MFLSYTNVLKKKKKSVITMKCVNQLSVTVTEMIPELINLR
jgi:hypothetical protein